MQERNYYLGLAKSNIAKCDAIIKKLEEKGRDVSKSKRLVSELETDLNDLNGRYRMRYSLQTVIDAYEISEFYLISLKKGGSIL